MTSSKFNAMAMENNCETIIHCQKKKNEKRIKIIILDSFESENSFSTFRHQKTKNKTKTVFFTFFSFEFMLTVNAMICILCTKTHLYLISVHI